MCDRTGLAETLLGLDGFRVLEVAEGSDEVVITIETVTEVVGCQRCGTRAEAKGRMRIPQRERIENDTTWAAGAVVVASDREPPDPPQEAGTPNAVNIRAPSHQAPQRKCRNSRGAKRRFGTASTRTPGSPDPC